ncbi:SPW repeat domain-containing protein [Pedobacter deserti]|uniref:SPW repeat domain-containing protein n=1 Tax=Pedobacter deserti TaxID=2817382 RepID=UPI00210A2B7B|nr:SPW repeat protein [Pedobacter sp. SYSU D00382]
MHIISRKFHAVLDYMSGAVLIAAPWLLNFDHSDTGAGVAVFAGILILVMSLMTDYEGGVMRVIPMSGHLNMDVLLGVLLAASPWLLGYASEVFLPHVVMGLLAIGSGLLTVRRSLNSRLAK